MSSIGSNIRQVQAGNTQARTTVNPLFLYTTGKTSPTAPLNRPSAQNTLNQKIKQSVMQAIEAVIARKSLPKEAAKSLMKLPYDKAAIRKALNEDIGTGDRISDVTLNARVAGAPRAALAAVEKNIVAKQKAARAILLLIK